MGVFKNIFRYTLGRNLSKKHPHLSGTAYMMLGSMNDEIKKEQKISSRSTSSTSSDTSGKSLLVFLVGLFVFAALVVIFNPEEKKEQKVKENIDSKKVYKTNSQEYFKMLNYTAKDIADKYDNIYLFRTKTSATTYYHIILYSTKYINETEYGNIKESYVNELKEKLSKYKYRETFLNNYNIVQVYFYNYQNHYPYDRDLYKWVQFYVTDLD